MANSFIKRAKESMIQDFTAGAEALAKEMTLVRVICLMAFLLYAGFNQSYQQTLANEICNLQMQLQDQQKTQHGVPPAETFQGCVDKLGAH